MTFIKQNGSCDPTVSQALPILLTDALHDIAQPLTVLAALLAEAGFAAEPALMGDHLSIADRECRRAIDAVRSLQVAVVLTSAVSDTEGPS